MTLQVRTVAEQAFEQLRERILAGTLVAGIPLRQDALADELGISKIPLREALGRLEQDGLVTSIANRGYTVCGMSAAEAEEVFQLRLRLEPDAAAQACLRVDGFGRAAAQAAFDAIVDGIHGRGADGLDDMRRHRTFHCALVAPGVGRLTGQLVAQLHVQAERYVRMHLEPEGRDSRAVAEHADILAAWLDRKPRRVSALLRRHISATLRDVQSQLGAAAR